MSIIRVPSDVRTVDLFVPSDCPAMEPSFFGVTAAIARQFGHRVTNAFLDLVDRRWVSSQYLVYSWNTPLKPGLWPTPGVHWHTDGVSRESFLDLGSHEVTEHIGCSLIYEGPDDATTEFALGMVELDLDKRSEPQAYRYGWWHSQVEAQVNSGRLERFRPQVGEVLQHDHRAFHHTPMPTGRGKRLLIGASRFPNLSPALLVPPKNLGPSKVYPFVTTEDGLGWRVAS